MCVCVCVCVCTHQSALALSVILSMTHSLATCSTLHSCTTRALLGHSKAQSLGLKDTIIDFTHRHNNLVAVAKFSQTNHHGS